MTYEQEFKPVLYTKFSSRMLLFTVVNISFSIIFSSIDYLWLRFCDVFSYIFRAYIIQ